MSETIVGNSGNVLEVLGDGTIDVRGIKPISTVTQSTVATKSSNYAAFASSNTARVGMLIGNYATHTCYVNYGSTGSTVTFSVCVLTMTNWSMPHPVYTGAIVGTWASGVSLSGGAVITELVR